MPLVFFSHNKVQEKEYLSSLLKQKNWFENEKFEIFLPENKEILNGNSQLDKKIIWLIKEWKKTEEKFFEIVSRFQGKKLSTSYQCHVSFYGPEGEYFSPNRLFIRLRIKQDEKRVIETVAHELLHLIFYDFCELNKLRYEEREGLIDSLILQSDLHKLFPQYKKQSISVVPTKLLITTLN